MYPCDWCGDPVNEVTFEYRGKRICSSHMYELLRERDAEIAWWRKFAPFLWAHGQIEGHEYPHGEMCKIWETDECTCGKGLPG